MPYKTRRRTRSYLPVLLFMCGSRLAIQSSSQQLMIDPMDKPPNPTTAASSEATVGEPNGVLKRSNELLLAGEIGEAIHILGREISGWEQQLSPGKAPNTNGDEERSSREEELAGEREHEKAVELFVRALRVSEAVFGKETRKMAEDVQQLGRHLLQKGQASEAATILSWSLGAQSLGQETVERVSGNLQDLVEALSRASTQGGGDEDDIENGLAAVDDINRLSWRYFAMHEVVPGYQVLRKALEGFGEEEGIDLPTNVLAVSAYLFNLGFLKLAVLGEYAAASDLFSQSLSLRTPLLGKVHTLTVQAVVSRGWALTLTGQTKLALSELTSCARSLLKVGKEASAERILRQAIQSAMHPLGSHTYAYACFTQHTNFLKWSGASANKRIEEFMEKQRAISDQAALPSNYEGVVTARALLAHALKSQVLAVGEGGLLELSETDRSEMNAEVKQLPEGIA